MSRGWTVLKTELTTCCLCGSDVSKLLFAETYRLGSDSADLAVVQCRSCDLIYVSPRLTLESTAFVYANDAQQTISHNYCWDGSEDGSRFTNLLNRLEQYAPTGQLLDVGCGGGHLLAEAKRRNRWKLIGCDPSEQAAKQAETAVGCRVFSHAVEEVEIESASCDIVTMLGVLEHLHNPVATLRHVGSLMRTGGILGVYVPNFQYLRLKDTGLLSYARSRRWSDLHPQEHLHQYTPQTLKNLLNHTGFELLHVEIGHPFMHGSAMKRLMKKSAYQAVKLLKFATGIHFGGLEVTARFRGAAKAKRAA